MMTSGSRNVYREDRFLASYAMHAAESAGRKFSESAHAYRGPYQRDRDRIIHSSAYRRLAYKTQVFTGEMGDYHRTRLTHTLEVTLIARTLARALALNEDLVEALALLHDIGHPPFGHAGEAVLSECLQAEGGFDHNSQALRLVELLELRYPTFPGLNLTLEVLEGQACRTRAGQVSHQRPLLEVQTVDIADSIAYDAHDADDALEVGLLQTDDLADVPIWQAAAGHARRRYANLDDAALRRVIVHWLIDQQVTDALSVAQLRIRELNVDSVADVRAAEKILTPSAEMAEEKAMLEAFLFERVYRHPEILTKREVAQHALREMFFAFLEEFETIPILFRQASSDDHPRRAVADYLACMTDRLVWEGHVRINRR